MGHSFYGMYESKLDDKNRIRIPAKFKKDFTNEYGETSYKLLRGVDSCIYVLPEDVYAEIEGKLQEEKLGDASPATMAFYSFSFDAEEDGQGRVILPSVLRNVAGIQKDLVIVGRGKRLEIWSAEKYNARFDNLDYDSLFKSLGI